MRRSEARSEATNLLCRRCITFVLPLFEIAPLIADAAFALLEARTVAERDQALLMSALQFRSGGGEAKGGGTRSQVSSSESTCLTFSSC